MLYRTAVMLGLLGLFAATSVQAATVDPVLGEVHVTSKAGYRKLDSGVTTEVAPGNRVMVGPRGIATIRYSANCSVKVPSGLWAVQAKEPCPQGVAMLDFTKRMNQSAPPADDGDTTLTILGGLVVAGTAGAIVLLDDDDNRDIPFSP